VKECVPPCLLCRSFGSVVKYVKPPGKRTARMLLASDAGDAVAVAVQVGHQP
jgi:hypothetical protein